MARSESAESKGIHDGDAKPVEVDPVPQARPYLEALSEAERKVLSEAGQLPEGDQGPEAAAAA